MNFFTNLFTTKDAKASSIPTGTPTKPEKYNEDKEILWFVKLWCSRCGLVSDHNVIPNKDSTKGVEYECNGCQKRKVVL